MSSSSSSSTNYVVGWSSTDRARLTPLVKREYGYVCHLCNEAIPHGQYSVDHVIPRRDGGTNTLENLRPAHLKCNTRRGAKSLNEYKDERVDNTEWFFNP